MGGKMTDGLVSVIAGSKSDEHVVKKVVDVLEEFGIDHEVKYISAHREPEKLKEYIKNSESKVDVYICVAGLSAALPGVVASHTSKPVIGVPVNVKLNGLDALLSMVQMPSGVPVATVGIDNGKNAAHLAIRILKLKYPELK
jgi:5-(carboxyamino)imidazole ribonucleotide mutase